MPVNIHGTTGITTPGMESTAMPTVGGDAVVESGSNSDGEWTRWADGTQQVARTAQFTGESSTAVTNVYGFPPKVTLRNMAQEFIAIPKVSVYAYTAVGSASWGSSGGFITASLFPSEVRCFTAAPSSSDYHIHQVAIGRWK